MLRAIFLVFVTLVAAGSARAAGDIDTCRNKDTEPVARLAACETVIADNKMPAKSRAGAFGVRGEALVKKRDYDGAIVAYTAAIDLVPDNAGHFNMRGLAYSSKGEDERALADYAQSSKLQPNFSQLPTTTVRLFSCVRATCSVPSTNSIPPSGSRTTTPAATITASTGGAYRPTASSTTRRSPISPRQKRSIPTAPQVAAYRCLTYTEIRKFEEALADCNVALAHTPASVYAMTSRGNVYLAKGDLDAALKDYNEALKINPNNIRAHANRGKVFEKRGDVVGARSEYRSASAALTKFDDIDAAIARRFAKERLAALTTAAPGVDQARARSR